MEINLFKKSEHVYWIWLALKLNNRNTVFQRLLDIFDNSPYAIYRADESIFSRVEFLSEYQKQYLLDKNIDEAMSIHSYCKCSQQQYS